MAGAIFLLEPAMIPANAGTFPLNLMLWMVKGLLHSQARMRVRFSHGASWNGQSSSS